MRSNVVYSQKITTAAVDAQGGVGLVVRDRPQGWSKESTRFHGPIMVICEVITNKKTPLTGTYLPPSTLEHLTDLEEALAHFQNQEPIVLGDLNTNIQSQNPRS